MGCCHLRRKSRIKYGGCTTDFPQYFSTVVTGDLLDFAKTVPFTVFLLCCGGVMMKEPRSLIVEEMKKYVECFLIGIMLNGLQI